MDQKILETMFEQSQKQQQSKSGANQDKKLQFTEEEASRFKRAFEDPKFREMFSEYMDEIQDPKHRQETEAYIAQLEGEQKIPEGKELVRPLAGFVAKTHKKPEKKTAAATKEKLFLNIVQSEKIAKPSKTTTNKGDCWSVPYSLGPPHMEKDKKGENSTCFDCCFHPEALTLGELNIEFKNLLVNTAMEGVEEYYKRAQQTVQLDRDFHIVKGINYKEGVIPAMMIATASKETWTDKSSTGAKQPSSKDASTTSKSLSTTDAKMISSGAKNRADPPASTSDDEKEPIASSNGKNDSNTKTTEGTKLTESTKLPTKAKAGTTIKKGFLVNNSKKPSLYPDKIPTIRPKKEDESVVTPASITSPTKDAEKGEKEIAENLSKALSLSSSDPVPKKEPAVITENELKALSTKRKVVEKVEKPVETVPIQPTTKEVVEEVQYPITPTVVVKHRDEISLGDFGGNQTGLVQSNKPKELIYEIQLPLVSAPSKINLDVSEKRLCLTYLEKYKLDMNLPYTIYDKKGKAAYDKSKKVLKVTLPVVPDVKENPITEAVEAVNSKITEEKKVEEISSAAGEDKPETEEEEETTTKSKDKKKKKPAASKLTEKSHNRWVEKSAVVSTPNNSEVDESKKFYQEIQQKAEQARLEALTKPAIVPPRAPTVKEERSSKVKSLSEELEESTDAVAIDEYVPSVKFIGRKAGYVFQLGEKGLGYYKDIATRQQKKVAQEKKSDESIEPPVDNTVTTTTTTTSASSEVKEEYSFPLIEMKQTKGAVSILFQVAGIIKPSVQVKALSNYLIQVSFSAFSDNSNQVEYGIEFQLTESEVYEGINPTTVTFDVAGKNMVMILLKNAERIYGAIDFSEEVFKSSQSEDDKKQPSWIKFVPLAKVSEKQRKENEQNQKPMINEPTKSSSSTVLHSVAGASDQQIKSLATEAFQSTVNAMQFSTDFISELD